MRELELRLIWAGWRRSPGWVAAVVIALAVGIGGSTLVFSVADTLLLRPLPYAEPDRLVTVKAPVSSWELFEQLQTCRAFDAIGAHTERAANLTVGDATERALVTKVTEGALATLGVSPAIGRSFAAAEYQPGKGQVALLTDDFWRRHYSAAPDVAGRTLVVDDRPYTVVGVLPRTFKTLGELEAGADSAFDRRVAIVVPFAGGPLYWRDTSSSDPGGRELTIIGRLGDHVSLQSARAQVMPLVRRVPWPTGVTPLSVTLIPVTERVVHHLPEQVTLLSIAVGLLLLVACANVANLLLERGEARQGDAAIRAALGASTRTLVWSAVFEVLMLSVAGGVVGMAFAWAGIGVIQAAAGGLLTRLDELAINARLLGFALVASIVAALVSGLVPTVRLATSDPGRWLHTHGGGPRAGRLYLPSRLVVGEVALSVVLVLVGAWLVRDFLTVASMKSGFDPAGVLTADISLTRGRYTGERAHALFDSVLTRVAALPNVDAVALANPMPGSYAAFFVKAEVEGRAPSMILVRIVSPHYFSLLSIPVVAGRAFSDRDTAAAPRVVMVNDVFARKCWGEMAGALGKRIAIGAKASYAGYASRTADEFGSEGSTVIGVSGSVRDLGGLTTEQPEVYWTVSQSDVVTQSHPLTQASLLLKARRGDVTALATPLRDVMRTIDPHQPLYNVQTLAHVMSAKLARQRLLVTTMAAFAALALVLAFVGIHGVIAYAVTLRRHEFAVRLALGSTRGAVLGLVLRRSLTLVAIGLALGVPTALAWTWFSSAQVFGVTGTDPVTCVLAAVFVAAVGVAASAIPAWQASRLNALVALREE